MDLLGEIRSGNRIFRLTFPDGLQIPFKLLSWERYQQYQTIAAKQNIPQDILEDAIFRECVVDQLIIDQMPELMAGVIPTVINSAMSLSGPTSVELFNHTLDLARNTLGSIDSQIIMIICRAFPSYKPDDVVKMQWKDVLIRLAQAERILMTKNPPELTEPLKLLTETEVETTQNKKQKIDVDALVKDGKKMEHEVGKFEEKPNGGLSREEMLNAIRVREMRRKRG